MLVRDTRRLIRRKVRAVSSKYHYHYHGRKGRARCAVQSGM